MSNQAALVHTTLVPVQRGVYEGERLLNDPVSVVDSEAYSIMKNVSG